MNRIEGMNLPQPKQNFTIKDTAPVECPECNNTVFQNGVIFRKVSKILAGTDKDALVPITIPYCVNCLEPLQELLPSELKTPKIQITDPV
jgi:hypothetical protein